MYFSCIPLSFFLSVSFFVHCQFRWRRDVRAHLMRKKCTMLLSHSIDASAVFTVDQRSGNLVTSINNTQNGHKGISSNQGDSSVVGSPARRSEVSPIQNHVSTYTLYHLINFISLLNNTLFLHHASAYMHNHCISFFLFILSFDAFFPLCFFVYPVWFDFVHFSNCIKIGLILCRE